MKKLFVMLIGILLINSIAFGQASYFGKTSGGDYETKTLFIGSKADTAYSSTVQAQHPIGTLKFYLFVDTASANDSLWVYLYESPDGTDWKQITSTAFTTITAAGSQVITVTNAPKFFRTRYYVMGASSAFYFKLKVVAKP